VLTRGLAFGPVADAGDDEGGGHRQDEHADGQHGEQVEPGEHRRDRPGNGTGARLAGPAPEQGADEQGAGKRHGADKQHRPAVDLHERGRTGHGRAGTCRGLRAIDGRHHGRHNQEKSPGQSDGEGNLFGATHADRLRQRSYAGYG